MSKKADRDAAETDVDDELFWDVAGPYLGSGRLDEGTLMSSRCVRANGDFVAMADYRTGDLVVKLPAARVSGLVGEGIGLAFAPGKKVFKEWVQVPGRDVEQWEALLAESVAFVSGATSADPAP